MREDPGAPCINYSWMTNTSYMSRVTGRDYWANREEVFIEYIRRTGVNLVPQWYFPAGPQQNMEQGRLPHAHHPGGSEQINSPDEILQIIETGFAERETLKTEVARGMGQVNDRLDAYEALASEEIARVTA